jgi:serine/threonine protein kinase
VPTKKPEVLSTPFDSYTIEQPRGAGVNGEVFIVRDADRQAFAAKVLEKKRATAARLKLFRAEASFSATTTHPNILRIHDRGVTKKGLSFYIMPLYSQSLRNVLATGIAPETVLGYFAQILDGIEAAHLERVVHLDLKPENILHSATDDRFAIADFGMAHFLEEELHATSNGNAAPAIADTADDGAMNDGAASDAASAHTATAAATLRSALPSHLRYAAPEQTVAGHLIDHRADIYSLGLILNEMFTSSLPQSNQENRIATIGFIAPDYAYLDGMVAWMTAEDPGDRPATIDEIKKQLIARGNEFVSRQRLNTLKTAIIPEGEAGDSFLANPIRIVAADYSEGIVHFRLNSSPTPNWIAAFKNPRAAVRYYTGAEPDTFVLTGDSMNVHLPNDADATQFVQYTKSYIELANGQYREHVIAFHQRQMQAEREVLRRQMAEEERRLKVLEEIRAAI